MVLITCFKFKGVFKKARVLLVSKSKSLQISAATGRLAISHVSLPFHQNFRELAIFMQQCKAAYYHLLNMHEESAE